MRAVFFCAFTATVGQTFLSATSAFFCLAVAPEVFTWQAEKPAPRSFQQPLLVNVGARKENKMQNA